MSMQATWERGGGECNTLHVHCYMLVISQADSQIDFRIKKNLQYKLYFLLLLLLSSEINI